MVKDEDVIQSAAGLLKIHGDQAEMECADMVERWKSRGDTEAANLWMRVSEAVRQLQAQRPR